MSWAPRNNRTVRLTDEELLVLQAAAERWHAERKFSLSRPPSPLEFLREAGIAVAYFAAGHTGRGRFESFCRQIVRAAIDAQGGAHGEPGSAARAAQGVAEEIPELAPEEVQGPLACVVCWKEPAPPGVPPHRLLPTGDERCQDVQPRDGQQCAKRAGHAGRHGCGRKSWAAPRSKSKPRRP
jgi:hypothetical protein